MLRFAAAKCVIVNWEFLPFVGNPNEGESNIQRLIMVMCTLLWIIKVAVWKTPNDVLHDIGFRYAVSMEFAISFILGLLISVAVYKGRSSYTNKWMYRYSLITGIGLAGVLPLLILFSFVAVIFFGATV